MITDKEIQELVGNAKKEIEEKAQETQETKIDYIFYNLKAYLQSTKCLKDIIDQVNTKLVENGEAMINMELGKDYIKINNFKIEKHFDFNVESLYFTAVDFFTQIYSDNDFIVTTTFLNDKKSKAQLEIEI